MNHIYFRATEAYCSGGYNFQFLLLSNLPPQVARMWNRNFPSKYMTLYQTCIQMDIQSQKYLQWPINMFRNAFQTLGSCESSSFLPLRPYRSGRSPYSQGTLQQTMTCSLEMSARVIQNRLKISWTWMHLVLRHLVTKLRLMPVPYRKECRGRIAALLKTRRALTHAMTCCYTKLITTVFLCRLSKRL